MSGNYKPFFPGGWKGATDDRCQPVATPVAATGNAKLAEICGFLGSEATVATVATIPAPSLPWSDGLNTLRRLPVPQWMTDDRWDRLVRTALTLSRDWGEQALAFGWTEIDLFGCNPEPWARRLDRDGLAVRLAEWGDPIAVRAISRQAIALAVDRGNILRFYHHERRGSVPLWVAYGQSSGP